MNTELIYTALFERLKTIEGFTTVSRRLRHFNMVQATERPALFLTQGNQTETPKKGLKAKIIFTQKELTWLKENPKIHSPRMNS